MRPEPRPLRSGWRRLAGHASPPGGDPSAAVAEADRLRDARRCVEAAAAYGRALALEPDRADLRVQQGNMLKDAGRPRDAAEAYRLALAARPEDPDVHLQLGHALKALGERAPALAAYRRASRLGLADVADRELAALGEPEAQGRAFAARPWEAALREAAALRGAVEALRRELDRVSAALPALGSALAVPVEDYGRYRAALAIPPPPRAAERPVTVLCHADRAAPEGLDRQIDSVRHQFHGRWRLLVIGTGPAAACRALVGRHAGEDPRVSWWASGASPAEAELDAAAGESGPVLLLAPGARLDPAALGWFALAFDLAPEAEAFVCDEETLDEAGGRPLHRDPVLRQAVDLDALRERDACGETLVVRADALRRRRGAVLTTSLAAARASLLLDLARDGAVGHVPFPLVHRAGAESPADPAAHAAAVAHADRAEARRARPSALPGAARLAVIVPSRDNGRDVAALVASLSATAEDRSRVEVIVMDDGSTDPDTLAILHRLAARGEARRIRVEAPFNWSRLSNRGAAATDAPLLVFANDDTRMLSRGWDARLRALLGREEVGAVGAKLLYPDGTLQHAGILFGWTPTPTHHDGLHRPGGDEGPAGRWAATRAVSAVTGAFLTTRRDAFAAAGGFDEAALPVGYGDVDYALKLRAAGHRILWTPHIVLTHHESRTRGLDHLDPAKAARAAAEDRLMRLRWPGVLARDPGAHPAWRPESLPFRLLDPWSADRAAEHIALTGRRNPWLVPPPSAIGSTPRDNQ